MSTSRKSAFHLVLVVGASTALVWVGGGSTALAQQSPPSPACTRIQTPQNSLAVGAFSPPCTQVRVPAQQPVGFLSPPAPRCTQIDVPMPAPLDCTEIRTR